MLVSRDREVFCEKIAREVKKFVDEMTSNPGVMN